ncbi:hypothetical protein [Buttiauxella ferragutiae]|uniref:hypothetical protein n=1 Tax=Buttiauxella ferragutiae TaxID=82989 RepID=UPI001F53D233|nr:hypothetical protein [Buttiauxella ferragutiae]UNK59295.1 hypothetical protein MNO13_12790 [Buttiauxella ferragutiae]
MWWMALALIHPTKPVNVWLDWWMALALIHPTKPVNLWLDWWMTLRLSTLQNQ